MSVPTHTKALDLAYIALMAALIALCAWISVPLGPVPFTMQTFGIFAALGLLGGRRGTLAFLIYLLLGIVGLPVFSGFSAGAGVLFGATGGYLLGYLAAALLFWGLTAKLGQTLPVMASAMVLGLVLCYGLGHGAGAGALLCLRHLLVSHRLHRRQRGDPAGRPDPVCVPLCSA